MAPDRGPSTPPAVRRSSSDLDLDQDHELSESTLLGDATPSNPIAKQFTKSSDLGLYATKSNHHESVVDATNFTFRGVAVGLLIGVIICFSNTYFGLQTGWVSGMAMPASLIGFAAFKSVAKHLTLPFTPVENVLVQTVAGAVGTMPLGLGFVGVMPSLEFLLKKSEGAPVKLELWRLIVWGIGLCLFGVVFGVPLRKQVIIRERLKFPSGTATALMISVLHGGAHGRGEVETQGTEEREQLLHNGEDDDDRDNAHSKNEEEDMRGDWKKQIRFLLYAFGGSGIYTLVQYFIPVLHKLPIFGTYMARTWVWTLNPSPAYVGQGIIMGPATTLHMLLGAILGWAVLSPLAKQRGWAPGPVNDWESGSKGWIVWISLAIMLADAVVNLGWLVLRPAIFYGPQFARDTAEMYRRSSDVKEFVWSHLSSSKHDYSRVNLDDPMRSDKEDVPDDAPPHHLISGRAVSIWLPITMIVCVVCVHVTFGEYMPLSLNILALVLALLLSIMGVRALGETDLNPVSGISKLTQLLFALAQPTGKHAHHAIIINLLAGAVSESGALQAGDILQDLKAGHLIGASPKAQFYGQLIGSVVGAVVSACVYKLYVNVYDVPGELFQVPTAYVWIFTARLVTGRGLPAMAWQYALGAGGIFTLATMFRIWLMAGEERSWRRKLHPWIPGGIAVAVGMYNTPSFTLARTVGGLISLWWVTIKGNGETGVIVLASGLILGEGVVSIVNLVLASLGVPHL
ncbi:OPT superfamily [Exophiala xenobiotica]|uniref:OPT superfamily n=1 Tax=Lithohypha guttulata TaxID=1690604 RepID=A0ABR0KGH6_9EURO|nr:OPT superfamily [Lithohypha guttulata]KAK5323489.1 OPT superfamily [Exophiala xenobiotica]